MLVKDPLFPGFKSDDPELGKFVFELVLEPVLFELHRDSSA